jgi:TonB family protein
MKRAALVLALAACAGGGPRPSPFPPPLPLGAEPVPPDGLLGRSWLDAVHEELHPRWALGFLEQSRVYLPPGHALNDARLETTLRFAVGREGEVRDVETARSSGNRDFDAAARELLAEAAPLPAPPPELVSDDGVVHVTWRFARDARQDGVAGAAIERRQWEPGRAVPALLAAGRVDEAAARLAAAFDGDEGPRLAREVAGAALVAALEDVSDPAARDEAAAAVADAGWKPAAPALRRLAVEANDLGAQSAALRALGALRDPEAPAILFETLERFDDERSATAASALAELGKQAEVWARLAPRARGGDPQARTAAFVELAAVGADGSAPVLVAALGDRLRSRSERVAAAVALGPLARDARSAATRALHAALGDGDAAVRAASAAALAGARVRAPAISRAVGQLLHDRDPRVQEAAARAVAAHRRRQAAGELARLALRSADPTVVETAVAALGGVPGVEALAQLRRFAAGKDQVARVAAAGALAERPEPEARAILRGFAGDPDARARALGVSASRERDVLERALGDPAVEVRAAAVAPLCAVAGVPAAPAILRALAAARGPAERVPLARALLLALPR